MTALAAEMTEDRLTPAGFDRIALAFVTVAEAVEQTERPYQEVEAPQPDLPQWKRR